LWLQSIKSFHVYVCKDTTVFSNAVTFFHRKILFLQLKKLSMSIIVQNITKQYDKQLALNNVSLTIGKGEIVGLLGPNGAGKSTLMKIITCFIPPTKGTVNVEGYDIWEQSMEVRKRVGYLPEHNPLYLDMYVKEYLGFVAGIHHITGQEASKRIDEMIEMTGLGVEMHKKIGALSKGYRQRVGLAQAMIHNPSVLILDEPTSGLDPNQLIDIRRLIKDLGNEKTVLLSTHIMQEVEALCDKVIIINKGVVVANDNIENLTKDSDNVLVVEFDGNVTIEMLRNIVGLKQAKAIKGNHWILEPKADLDIRQDLMRWSINNNVIIRSMQREETSIEECFQRLTK